LKKPSFVSDKKKNTHGLRKRVKLRQPESATALEKRKEKTMAKCLQKTTYLAEASEKVNPSQTIRENGKKGEKEAWEKDVKRRGNLVHCHLSEKGSLKLSGG